MVSVMTNSQSQADEVGGNGLFSKELKCLPKTT